MEKTNNPFLLPGAIVVAGVIIAFGIAYKPQSPTVEVAKETLPEEKFELPVNWGSLGRQLVENGVIDGPRFEKLYVENGEYPEEYDKLLNGDNSGKLKITKENAGFLLNLLWAFGLANQNEILTEGEMSDPRYGGAERFASTAGWTMAQGNAMDHFSRHQFITLIPEQQRMVDKVSREIYRPCCDNSAHFPDCNHGMAMLGLLELMASQETGEEEMRRAALTVNSFWFPGAYVPVKTPRNSGSGCGV